MKVRIISAPEAVEHAPSDRTFGIEEKGRKQIDSQLGQDITEALVCLSFDIISPGIGTVYIPHHLVLFVQITDTDD